MSGSSHEAPVLSLCSQIRLRDQFVYGFSVECASCGALLVTEVWMALLFGIGIGFDIGMAVSVPMCVRVYVRFDPTGDQGMQTRVSSWPRRGCWRRHPLSRGVSVEEVLQIRHTTTTHARTHLLTVVHILL